MASNYDVMLRRPDAAPDDKRILLENETFEECLWAAARKYLQQGAVLVKDAGRQPRMSLQYKPGTQANLPQPLQNFSPYNTLDVNQNWGVMAPGAYIVTLTCETASVRYTTSGVPATSSFGMLVLKNTFIDITLQDLSALNLCATASGEIIDLEYFQIDA